MSIRGRSGTAGSHRSRCSRSSSPRRCSSPGISLARAPRTSTTRRPSGRCSTTPWRCCSPGSTAAATSRSTSRRSATSCRRCPPPSWGSAGLPCCCPSSWPPSCRSGWSTGSFGRSGAPWPAWWRPLVLALTPDHGRRRAQHHDRRDARHGPAARRARAPAWPAHERARWLALAFALVGVGFELKMLQAYLVLPAFAGAWLVAARGSLASRAWCSSCRRAAARGRVVRVGRLSLQLWPVDYRPWIGGSTTNSLFDLAFGYNGLDRLATGPAFGDTGTAGPLRFLEPVLAGQVGWLLPLAGLGVVLGLVAAWPRTEPTATLGRPSRATPACGEPGSDPRPVGRLARHLPRRSSASPASGTATTSSSWRPPSRSLAGSASASAGGRSAGPAPRAGCCRSPSLATGLLAAFTIAYATDLGWLAEPVLAASLLSRRRARRRPGRLAADRGAPMAARMH